MVVVLGVVAPHEDDDDEPMDDDEMDPADEELAPFDGAIMALRGCRELNAPRRRATPALLQVKRTAEGGARVRETCVPRALPRALLALSAVRGRGAVGVNASTTSTRPSSTNSSANSTSSRWGRAAPLPLRA